MNVSAFVTSVLTSFLVFVGLVLVHQFLCRRRGNAVIYYPSRLLRGLPPPSSQPFLAWARDAWRAPEQHIVDHAGLDVAVYMIFLHTALWIFLFAALYCIPVLMPLSGTDNFFEAEAERSNKTIVYTVFDKVAMGNINAPKVWKQLDKCKRELAHAEAVFNQSGKRPRHRTGLLGCMGVKVDSILYYNENIRRLTMQLKEEQTNAFISTQKGAAFVFFNNRAAATVAAQVMHSEYASEWTTRAAPEPREVVWENLPIPFTRRLVRRVVVYGVVLLTILFYMIPITFVSAIISLENLEQRAPFLRPVVRQRQVQAILQAYLPQLVLVLFLLLLPRLLRLLSRLEGIPARSELVRAAAGKYFYFNVFNVFLGVTLAGTLFTSLNDLVHSPTSVVSLLSKALPVQATFFITFVALKFFVGYGMELCQIKALLIYHFKRKYICKTEDEVKRAWSPKSFDYTTCVPADMLIFTIAVCYAIIAPAILPFAIVYFALGWLIKRNEALNVAVPSYESGGRMWPHIHSRILAALFLAQLTMLGYFSVKEFPYSPLLVPPLLATLVFAYVCHKFYHPAFIASPLVAACSHAKEPPTTTQIVDAYTPECLLPPSPPTIPPV